MSDAIQGVFFKNRKVGARALGAFGAAALTDGILNGCAVTISGGTATVAPGTIIVGGRPCRVKESVAAGTIGAAFSRIVAKVDLTKTSTPTEFEQVEFAVETASTLAALMTSDSNDINLSGSTHKTWIWIYDATGSALTYQQTYRYARATGRQLLWKNLTAGGASAVGNGFEEQRLVLPGMDGFRSFEITFALNTQATVFVTKTFNVPDTVFLATNDTTGDALIGKKYAKLGVSHLRSGSGWSPGLIMYERVLYFYPTEHVIGFSTGWASYPHYNSSSYQWTSKNYMIPVEIFGLPAGRRMAP